ncbi:MAG: DUF983 domain-containing protein [Ktedonobacterales bacterium]
MRTFRETYLGKVVLRGLRQRCPRCGRGKLFKHGFTMYERCPSCGWVYEREEGYWTGAVAVNLVLTELIAAAIVIPLAARQFNPLLLYGLGIPLIALLPLLFYRITKGIWMSIDFILNPTSLR